MNILYVGPYKHNSCLSLSCLDIIETLQNNPKVFNLTIKPIFINDQIFNRNSLMINNLENKDLYEYEYDYAIYHSPISLLTENNKHIAKVNVAIPLFTKIIGREEYKDTLENFDMVLCDSEEYTNFLHKNYDLSNVKTFGYSKLYTTSYNINFGYNMNDIKLYWIGSYDNELFEKIITSFYLAFYDREDISLFLFLNQDAVFIKDNLDEKIQNIRNKLNIVTTINNINVVAKPLNIDDINAIHNTCDIYLDITKANSESMLNSYIANRYKKKIIRLEKNTFQPNMPEHIFSEDIECFNTRDFAIQLKSDILSETNNIPPDYPNIIDCICQ
jgi:hypothetical protein